VDEGPYRIDQKDEYTVVCLLPGMNDRPWDEIESLGAEVVEKVAERKKPSILVDLAPLNYMGSALVALIVRIWKSVQEQEGRLVVVVQDDMVREVLTLAGLTKVWTIVGTRDEGLYELGVSKEAVIEKRESRLLVFVGPLAVLVAAIALGLMWSPAKLIERQPALVVAIGMSALAMFVGLLTVVREMGQRRLVAILVVLLAASIGTVATLEAVEVANLPWHALLKIDQ
jgi:anti-anti-sigma factor